MKGSHCIQQKARLSRSLRLSQFLVKFRAALTRFDCNFPAHDTVITSYLTLSHFTRLSLTRSLPMLTKQPASIYWPCIQSTNRRLDRPSGDDSPHLATQHFITRLPSDLPLLHFLPLYTTIQPQHQDTPFPLHIYKSAIMGYTDIDRKAINTIRTLAVSLNRSFKKLKNTPPSSLQPHYMSTNAILHGFKIIGMDSIWNTNTNKTSASDRCHLQGQLWPPRCANGYGSSRSRPLQQDHEVQPKEPKVVEPW